MPKQIAESVEKLPDIGAILKALARVWKRVPLILIPPKFAERKLKQNELILHGHVATCKQDMGLLLLGFLMNLLYICCMEPHRPGRDEIRMMRG